MILPFAHNRHDPVDIEAQYSLELIDEEQGKRSKAELQTIQKAPTIYKDGRTELEFRGEE
jgi:hypothetical protein